MAPGREGGLASAAAWTRPTSATITSPRMTSGTARRSSSTTTSSAARRSRAGRGAAANEGHPGLERGRRHRGDRLAVPAGPGAKFIEMPKARYATCHEDQVLKDGRPVGVSMDCGYIANERVDGLARHRRHRVAEPGTEVTVVWGEQPNSAKPAVEDHPRWRSGPPSHPSRSWTSPGRATARSRTRVG